VDFMARPHLGKWNLLQVCAEISDPATREREVRSLLSAAKEFPGSTPVFLTLDSIPPQPELPVPLQWQPAAAGFWGLSRFEETAEMRGEEDVTISTKSGAFIGAPQTQRCVFL